MKFQFSRLSICFVTAFFLCVLNAAAQPNAAADNFAITNARIVTVSGAPIERGTIVVRNGLIQAVGANVSAPADVRVIDGAGLTVYPGFVDAHTNLGIAARQTPAPAAGGAFQQIIQQQQQPAAQSQSNSTFPTGLQPEISAADLIRANDAGFEAARNNGFTTALSVPRERLFLGQSALINLAGDNVPALILRAPVGLHIFFQSLQGGAYPTSQMGAYSAVRQMMLDAQRLQQLQKDYAANPRGVRRPEQNRSLEALFPILNREIPLVVQAETERQIVRALDFAREFNLRLIIAGGHEAWKLAPRLKAQNAAVLISLNFPRRTSAASPEADPEPLETLRLRAETPKNAARLKTAGVPFAFQSGGLTNLGDFYANAQRAVDGGLAQADALRAMTLGAAEIFGAANQIGTIETGKIANLTVTRGDVFAKTRAFTHTIVDGRVFEIRPPPAPPAGRPAGTPAAPGTTPAPGTTTPAAPLNVAGTWTLNIEVPGQSATASVTFAQEGNRLTGTVQSPFGNSEIQNGEITGENISFKIVATFGGQTFDVSFAGRVTGNTMSGTATAPQGAIPFSGTRNP